MVSIKTISNKNLLEWYLLKPYLIKPLSRLATFTSPPRVTASRVVQVMPQIQVLTEGYISYFSRQHQGPFPTTASGFA